MPGPGHLLQDEPLAAEEAGAKLALPSDLEGHRFFGAEEGLLAADQALAGGERAGQDGAGKARREGDVTGAVGGEIRHEEAAAAEGPFQPREETAAGIGRHLDIGAHPRHCIGLAEKLLAGRELDAERLHRGSDDLVMHDPPSRPVRRCGASRVFRGCNGWFKSLGLTQ